MRFGIILVALVLGITAYMVVKNNSTPALGVTDGRFKSLSTKPNGVSTQAENEEKRVAQLPFVGDMVTTKAEIIKASQMYGDCEVKSESENYIHMVFTTGKMKYKDDVEFYLDVNKEIVEYRSESRVGYSDMGLNRERYNAIALNFSQLKEAK